MTAADPLPSSGPAPLTGLRLAVGTLTQVPVGALPAIDRRAAGWAMALAPVAALPVAVVAGATAYVAQALHLPALVVGALVCAALGWATRAMHWDGVADTADGLAAGWSRERALEVMRRGDTGPVGAAVLCLLLLADAATIGAVAVAGTGWLLVGAAVLVSRTACTLAARRGLPAARPDGLGVVVAGSVPAPVVGLVVVAATLACVGAAGLAGGHWWQGALAVLLAMAAVEALLRRCRAVLGGVTGDVIGAAVELFLFVVLLVLASGGAA
ncbi:adenosylcobinamide-GDP ribazoletransferase [Pedococcus sp. NPDC057267]|uniref:adenosylcobinamide-GDP ribazoletransferase n=1 Tax=Pedococcus sp. NPDC057267 TaxID=3346077 RepID=UPI0036330F46